MQPNDIHIESIVPAQLEPGDSIPKFWDEDRDGNMQIRFNSLLIAAFELGFRQRGVRIYQFSQDSRIVTMSSAYYFFDTMRCHIPKDEPRYNEVLQKLNRVFKKRGWEIIGRLEILESFYQVN